MKLLAIDIGNSNIKCGVIEDGIVLELWHDQSANAARVGKDLLERGRGLPVALCSVVPSVAQSLEGSFRRPDVTVTIESQKEVSGFYTGFGADRIADSVAAKLLYGKGRNVLVIGLGTGTVLTAISAEGHFAGGLITLGLGSTAQALSGRIPQLPPIELQSAEALALGFNTVASMKNGTLLAHLGALERWIAYAKSVLKGPTVTVATGGWSETLAKNLPQFDHVDTSLTLKGTYFIAEAALNHQS